MRVMRDDARIVEVAAGELIAGIDARARDGDHRAGMIGENAGQEIRARHIIIENDDLRIVAVSSFGDGDRARAPRQSRQINDVLLQPVVVAVVTEIALEIDRIRREIKSAKDIQAIETDVEELTVIR